MSSTERQTRCKPTLKNAVSGHQDDTRNKSGRQVTLDSYKSLFTIATRSSLWPHFARNIRSPFTASYRSALWWGTSLIPTLLTQAPLSTSVFFTAVSSRLYIYRLSSSPPSQYHRFIHCLRYVVNCHRAAEILHIGTKRRLFFFNLRRVYKWVVSSFVVLRFSFVTQRLLCRV